MWLSKTIALRQRAERESTAADMGVTTIGGGSASVMTRGEQRDLEVFAPGGVVWQPQAGDTVLVTARVEVSPTFLSWVLGFGRDMRILAPKAAQEAARTLCLEALSQYSPEA